MIFSGDHLHWLAYILDGCSRKPASMPPCTLAASTPNLDCNVHIYRLVQPASACKVQCLNKAEDQMSLACITFIYNNTYDYM